MMRVKKQREKDGWTVRRKEKETGERNGGSEGEEGEIERLNRWKKVTLDG